jgi:hypothetical protein
MSGDAKTVTQSNSEPWAGAQPALKTGLEDAQSIYASGTGFQPYTGSTVVPYSDQSMAGMNAIQNQATSALSGDNPMAKPLDFYSSLYDSGGLSADQQGVADQWRNTASGAELNNTSSAFNDILQRTQNDTRTGVDLSMSGAGRYGSPGAHQGVLADKLGGVTSQMLQDEYGRQLGRQDTARTSLAGLGQQGITNRFGAGEAMPGAWTNSQAPATDLMKVGSMYEDLAGRTMSDQQRIFNETQQSPLKAVEWLNAIGSGAGSLGGSQVGSSTPPSPNPFLQLLAGGLGAGSLLGGLF